MTIHRINPCKRWSDITVFNGIAHFVEVADSDTNADMKGQVEQIFAQAEAQLAKIGSDRSRILSVTIYVSTRQNPQRFCHGKRDGISSLFHSPVASSPQVD